jgi:hypothetical protein
MNHLITNIQNLDIIPLIDHKYDFLDFMGVYYNIQCIYNIVNLSEEYKLKNIYNRLLIQWSLIMKTLNYPEKYKNYTLPVYNKGIMKYDVFNSLVSTFIDNNKIIGVFVMNTILQFNF